MHLKNNLIKYNTTDLFILKIGLDSPKHLVIQNLKDLVCNIQILVK